MWVLDSWAEKLHLQPEREPRELYTTGDGQAWGTSFLKDLRPGAAATVLKHLEDIKVPIGNRTELMKELENKGHCRQTCAWMSSNLKRAKDGLEWTFCLPVLRKLIYDAANVDSLEVMKKATSRVVFVRAGKGMRWSQAALERLDEGLKDNPLVTHKVIESAEHWLHVDSPRELAGMMMPCFQRINSGGEP